MIGDRPTAHGRTRWLPLPRGRARAVNGGVLPVVKHIPGHGRATADSHHSLPVVEADWDTWKHGFRAFRPLGGMPLGMTAHVVFSAIDPTHPATTFGHNGCAM